MNKYESKDLHFLWEWLECSGRKKKNNSATPVEEFLIAKKMNKL